MEETEWHRVVFYDRLAEVLGEYLEMGRTVYIEGRLQARKWRAKDGLDQHTTEVIATDMQMLESPQDSGGRDVVGPPDGLYGKTKQIKPSPTSIDDDDPPF